MSALTSLLVRDGVVPVRRIEEALQRQVIAGGDIETVLLEMDAVAENVLAAYRASLFGLAPATRAEVMTVPEEVIRLVPAEVAVEHRLIPLAVHGRTLEVARREPLRPDEGEALGFLLRHDVVVRIACEVRIAAGLAHHFGAELSPRFTRLLDRLRKRDAGPVPEIGTHVRRELVRHVSEIPYKVPASHFEGRTRPMTSVAVDPVPHDERAAPEEKKRPRRTTSRGLGIVTDEEIERARREREERRKPVASIPDDDEDVDAGPVVVPSTATSVGRPPEAAMTWAEPPRETRTIRPAPVTGLRLLRGPLTLAGGERLLKRATERDEILEVFFSFARQFFDYTVLFVVHDDVADGREAWGVGAPTEEVRSIVVPLDRPSIFAEVRRLCAPLVRSVGSNDVEREVLAKLRRASPMPAALVMPIAIRQRVVLLLYGDRDGEDFELGAVMELVRFAARVIEAFEQLILRKKRAGYTAADPSAERRSLKEAAKTVAETAGSARPSADARRDGSAWKPGRRASSLAPPPPEADSWSAETPDQPPGAVVLPPRPAEHRATRVMPTEEQEAVLASERPAATAAAAASASAPVAPTTPSEAQRLPLSYVPGAPPERVLGIPRSAPPPPPAALDLGTPELAAALEDLVAKGRAAEAAGEVDDEQDEHPDLADEAGDDEPELVVAMEADHEESAVVDEPELVVSLEVEADVGHPDELGGSDEPELVISADDDGDADVEALADVAHVQDVDDETGDAGSHARADDGETRGDATGVEIRDGRKMEEAGTRDEPRLPETLARKPGTYRLRGGPIDVVRPGGSADGAYRATVRMRARSRRAPHRDEDGHGVPNAIARARAALRRPRSFDADTRSVIVDMGEQVHEQVADLLAAGTAAERDELIRGLLYLGEAALPALVQVFPGPLQFDRKHGDATVPAGRDVSVVARALVAFGERAVPYVAGLLSSGDADVRYYAALVASELVHPDLMQAVADRIHDPDAGVRRLACALLPRFAGYRGFDEIRIVVRRTARLRGKDPARRWQAVDALVALRDVEMLEKLIELLEEEDPKLVDHVHRALVVLTCSDQGRSYRRWHAWFEKHGRKHRIEWLIDGLGHSEESLRALAAMELERLTQERYGFRANAPKRERDRVQRRYRDWWREEGARRFT